MQTISQTITNIERTSSGGGTVPMSLVGSVTTGKNDYSNDDDNASNQASVTLMAITSTTIDGILKVL